jgi:hypothetical protein
MRTLFHRMLALCLAALTVATAGCFLSGSRKQTQRQMAAAEAPAAVAEPPRPTQVAAHVWHVRWRPNQNYLAQTVDAPKQLADLTEDANHVLEPALGLRLVEDAIVPWPFEADDDLRQSLDSLRESESAANIDLVVGLVGALPHQTDSLHEAGMARLFGKQIVLRAASRGGELDAIDQTFGQLSVDERAAILRQRKRHRALAVFLHEVGHCLGALHETDPESLMNRKYSPKVAVLGTPTLSLMQLALDSTDRSAVARAQLAVLEGPSAGAWLATERDAQVVALRAFIEGKHAVAARAPEDPLAGMAPDDRERYARAWELFRHIYVAHAYVEAKPLFAAYPTSIAVQDLRCQLAAVRRLAREELRRECEPVSQLRTKGDAGPSPGSPP